MPTFALPRTHFSRHFDIHHDRHGRWVARDRDGLAGGTFITRRDALRFAMFEAGGDASLVHVGGQRRGRPS
jgi:hypothetical protein